jgi:hypothetical protein
MAGSHGAWCLVFGKGALLLGIKGDGRLQLRHTQGTRWAGFTGYASMASSILGVPAQHLRAKSRLHQGYVLYQRNCTCTNSQTFWAWPFIMCRR